MTLFFIFLFSRIALPSEAQVASTVTLRQCYDWARQRSEGLKIGAEDVEQSRQRARAALAGALPSLGWELVDTRQDPAGVRRLQGQGFSGFIEKEQTESRFSLRQPLFSGLKEYNALRGFRKEESRNSLRLERAARELYETTAAAFYDVVGLEIERDNTLESLELALDRVKELRGFLKLGKARESELFTAQAHASALKAALSRTQASIGSARAELSFLAGRDLSLNPLLDELPDRPAFGGLAEAEARSLERADVRAQRADVEANRMRVNYEKGSYWPSLDLLGRSYTRRATFMREVAWDLSLSLQVPLFQGGRVGAEVQRARSAYRQSSLILEEVERRVLYLARRLHGELAAALEELRAQEEAAQAARKSYDALLEEYRLGLVTNLDVLQALDLLQAQRRDRNAARLRAKRLYVRLGVAMETLP